MKQLLDENGERPSLVLPFREMSEKLFQFIWQHQYFNGNGLQTTMGEEVEVIFPGHINHNQGPDFLHAKIRIGQAIFAGSVELHLKATQWKEHGHSADSNYRNVILHVVYEDNDPSASVAPVLELQSRISGILLERYTALMNSGHFIPCASSIRTVSELVWTSWKERLVTERLTRKAEMIFQFLGQNKTHWDQAYWWMLARNFGTKVNAEAFESMARSIPLNILTRHLNQIHHLEALLLGQAGLLKEHHGEYHDGYPKMLAKEYLFLRKKYSLVPISQSMHFLRMRPGNFPTVRLSQLAALIQVSGHLFSQILEEESMEQIRSTLCVTANDYWHYHYRPDEPSPFKKKTIGKEMSENILINTIIPSVLAYGLYHQKDQYREKALKWMEAISPEINSVTKGFMDLDISNRTAFDSQAFLELKAKYCEQRLCLHCAIGNAILNGP
ncbi:MAG: DUF2851 family protein [Flavisolibacter sp.]|jgi:hypothetical protein